VPQVRVLPGAPETPSQRREIAAEIAAATQFVSLGITWESRTCYFAPVRGHLEARGKNTWRAKVFLGRDVITGQRQYLTRTVHGTKREAEAVLNELLVEVDQGAHVGAAGTVADLWTRWIELNEDRLSPTTCRGYSALLERHILPEFGNRKVRTLRAAEIDAFYARLSRCGGDGGRPLSPQSVQRVHAVFRRLLNQAVKWGWCGTNPVTRTSPPRVHRYEFKLPSIDSVIMLIEAADKRDADLGSFLRLATVTGARRGEVCALRWQNIELSSGMISISRSIVDGSKAELIEKDTKTHSSRQIRIDDDTVAVLAVRRVAAEERAAQCGTTLVADSFVFSDSPDGRAPWRPGRVTLAFGRLCQRNGVKGVRLHDLRHFAASTLLGAGVPVKTVSGRLGHANAATTLNVYAHFLESSDADAAKVLGTLLRR
jgi:integrase